MTKHVLLNNVEHANLKVKTDFAEEYGVDIASTLTVPSEFGDIQKEYPILFRKNEESGKFQAIVLLGLEKGENLFLPEASDGESRTWQGYYVPGFIARGPFLIGFQDQSASGGSEKEPVIHIDLDDPRVGEDKGVPLFKQFGGNSAYLDNIGTILLGIHNGLSAIDTMFSVFEHYELIEPISINVELNNGEKIAIENHYTIDEKKLRALKGEALEKLNASGFLQGAYMVASSLGNLKKLIDIKNSRLSR